MLYLQAAVHVRTLQPMGLSTNKELGPQQFEKHLATNVQQIGCPPNLNLQNPKATSELLILHRGLNGQEPAIPKIIV